MKKLGKKRMITNCIVIVVMLVLLVTGVMLGTKSDKEENKKETDKKVDKIESIKEDPGAGKVEKEEPEIGEIEKEEPVVGENVLKDNETEVNDPTPQKETTNNTKDKVTTSKPSTSKPVTKPNPSHVHKWAEVKTPVAVPEKGHYETIYEQRTVCNSCQADITELSDDERDKHFEQESCKEVIYSILRVEAGKKWIVDTPATTELRVTGYKCSCGATREKTQHAGMYSLYDQASWDRINACYQFFKQGLAGKDTRISGEGTFLPYGNWESVVVSNGSSDGAWMWIFIRDWKLDDYSYLQDGVKEGIIDQEEAKMVEALYEEIPRIFKGAIERVAPQGGTELYNYVLKLINQTGGDPDAVPSLAGAKGIIPENIPGLYVTIEETRGGFSLMFWAE